MEKELRQRIYRALRETTDLDWHSWYWWVNHDEWFAQFSPEEIDRMAQKMANEGIIETNGRGGFRRMEKTWKEKIRCKLYD